MHNKLKFHRRVAKAIQQVKAGGCPTFTGLYLTKEQLDKLRPYANPNYFNSILKSRVPKESSCDL